jgi:hypothetical protein
MARARHLKEALHDRSQLRGHVRGAMGAFEGVDVKLIAEDQRPRIGDSLDLDAASQSEHPEANRWDYIISVPDSQRLAGIEPHTARDSEISVVILKKNHATEYLRSHLQEGYRITKWYWVTHGRVGFSKMERARRRLDQNGIEFAGRLLRNLD